MSLQLRTSNRNRNKPVVFTPAKYEKFSLNKNKALDKKLEACHRTSDVKVDEKHGNLILELSAAPYEVLKTEIEVYFEQHSTYKLAGTNQLDKEGLCTRTSYSVKNRRSNRQSYRINMFHTTSRIEINGHGMELFTTHFNDIYRSMRNKGDFKNLNKQIESKINKLREKNSPYM